MVELHGKNPKHQWATYAKEGWDSRDQIAEELECREEKVNEILKPSLEAGQIERREFLIWDKVNSELKKVVGYRKKQKGAEVKPSEQVVRKSQTTKSKGKKTAVVAVGARVRTRIAGTDGVVESVGRGRIGIRWDSGRITSSQVKAVAKGDLILLGEGMER